MASPQAGRYITMPNGSRAPYNGLALRAMWPYMYLTPKGLAAPQLWSAERSVQSKLLIADTNVSAINHVSSIHHASRKPPLRYHVSLRMASPQAGRYITTPAARGSGSLALSRSVELTTGLDIGGH